MWEEKHLFSALYHISLTSGSLTTGYSCWDSALWIQVITCTLLNLFTTFLSLQSFLLVFLMMYCFTELQRTEAQTFHPLCQGNIGVETMGSILLPFSLLFYHILKSLLDHTRPFLPDSSNSGRQLYMPFHYQIAKPTWSIFPILPCVFISFLLCLYYVVYPHLYTEEMPPRKLQTQMISMPFLFKRLNHSIPKIWFYFSFIYCQKWNKGKAEVYWIALLQEFISGLGLECVSNWASPLWNT